MSLARCEGRQSLLKEWLQEEPHGHQAWKRDIGWHAG
jgi:hypothetical protein